MNSTLTFLFAFTCVDEGEIRGLDTHSCNNRNWITGAMIRAKTAVIPLPTPTPSGTITTRSCNCFGRVYVYWYSRPQFRGPDFNRMLKWFPMNYRILYPLRTFHTIVITFWSLFFYSREYNEAAILSIAIQFTTVPTQYKWFSTKLVIHASFSPRFLTCTWMLLNNWIHHIWSTTVCRN